MKKTTLSKLHRCQIEILIEIDRISTKNNIRYYLIGGSLLGAVRHKGFIPWDDDLDIAMPREDYNKFIRCCKTQLSNKYFLQTSSTDKHYFYLFGKVRMNNTIFLQEDLVEYKMHHGIFVDIFPLDCSNGDLVLEKKKIKNFSKFSNHLIYRSKENKHFSKQLFFLWVPRKLIHCIRDNIMKGKGDYYVNYGSQYGIEKQTMPISVYDPPIKVEFEGKRFNAPHDFEYVLRKIYGDNYMKLPPLEKRRTHNPLRISFDFNGADEILED